MLISLFQEVDFFLKKKNACGSINQEQGPYIYIYLFIYLYIYIYIYIICVCIYIYIYILGQDPYHNDSVKLLLQCKKMSGRTQLDSSKQCLPAVSS